MKYQSKSQKVFMCMCDHLIWRFIGKFKRPRIAKTTLNKNEVGGLTLPDIKIYCKLRMILAQGETSRSRERNREFRLDPSSADTWHTTVVGKITRECMNFSIHGVERTGRLVEEKNVIGSWLQTIHENQLHIDERQNYKVF